MCVCVSERERERRGDELGLSDYYFDVVVGFVDGLRFLLFGFQKGDVI